MPSLPSRTGGSCWIRRLFPLAGLHRLESIVYGYSGGLCSEGGALCSGRS